MEGENKHLFEQYSRLYEKYAPGLLFYARRFTSHPVAEDIVHDVFLKIWKKDSFLIIDETISSYLFRAVQNSCLNYLQHQSIHQEYLAKAITELQIEELTHSSPDDKLVEQEQMDAIYSAIDQLPDKCREVFQLSYIEDKKNTEIAGILGISIRTVESHLYKALNLLRKNLIPLIGGLLFQILSHFSR